MKNIKMKVLTTVIVLSIMLAACTPQEEVVPDNAGTAIQEKAVAVAVASPVKGYVQGDAGLTGKLEANQSVNVVPKASGKVTRLSVKLGQKVNKGDVLFTVDQEDLANSVKTAEAQYESAMANLAQSKDNKSDNASQAQSALTQAQQTLEDAQRNNERMTTLFNQGAISQEEVENAKTKLVNAQTTYNNALKTFESSKKITSIVVAESSVKQAKAQLDNALDQLKNATVTAPISGVIGAVNGAIGEIPSSQSGVVTIVNTNPMKVKVQIAEAEVTNLQVGGKVSVQITVLNKTVNGTIDAISPVMNEDTKAYPLEILIPNDENKLKVGMVANVVIEKSNEIRNFVIPKTAVVEEGGKYYAYKVEGDTVKKVEIKVGNMSSEKAEVISGLIETDKVVYKGQTLINDGSKVKIE
ncbi:efflux RND transporter periplasmic adaptor subunit [Brevibacillus brevis]|uniref:efflux RND transporter periplasmic adaptor subunit n=1 Tax=Brevibacillus brevis TaxID=1393 RepID=UPI00115BDCAE|nr:efflux RND transporter periplasmic adaptor subunit [Lysinibacillus sp. SDF0063]TQR36412.1 efflux RND transporter periplasmic adaptor subunit [Lysinibacillus sp. SDF0063]